MKEEEKPKAVEAVAEVAERNPAEIATNVAAEAVAEATEPNPVETADNIVLRKLLVSCLLEMPIWKYKLVSLAYWLSLVPLLFLYSFSVGQGISILRIVVGAPAIIVAKRGMRRWIVLLLGEGSRALFVGVWSTMQSNAQRSVLELIKML